ncbi:hypothetical protein CVT24_006078 [Panaeolus cyanescens]|uniref:Uncharacterized protein n=1 Tax=Panaeolus cyanescens TaxID=181874 RepID=A0A409V8R2_9AGAR|nr:hypothetical protein CVT24_006078 [Panaeolus cyanescens]
MSSSYSQSNPIDLTLDDDDDDYNDNDQYPISRYSKRARTDSPSRHSHPPPPASPFFNRQPSSMRPPSTSSRPLPPSFLPSYSQLSSNSLSSSNQQPYRPPFAGPSPYQPIQPATSAQSSHNFHHQNPVYQSKSIPQQTPTPSSSQDRHVIDLTRSPSPPQNPHVGLPPELPPKTPVCIGQLGVNALILYPVPYLLPRNPGQTEWATVRLQYEHNPNKASKDTIHVKSPHLRGLNGETLASENFGVIEQKVSDSLGPMLGKGLIRLDAKIRKGPGNLPILPLQMLVYTPKGNIKVVGTYLQQTGLILHDPTPPYDPQRISNCHYYNPHDPQSAYVQSIMLLDKLSLVAQQIQSRWTAPTYTTSKSVEVQRNQVDELFKTLKDGDELKETEPTSEVATRLYPHQKKALTFLLAREQEVRDKDDFMSLWQMRVNPLSHQTTWQHLVTKTEVKDPPQEAKGAILADDMGLGKTITCVSLIAATLDSSIEFAASPLDSLPPPPPRSDAPTPSHFAGSVFGMPETAEGSSSSKKAQAKAERLQEKMESQYARCCRIKAKSRATLIICPLSTVSNWEDQFREHWKGEVSVVGGNGGASTPAHTASSTPHGSSAMQVDEKPAEKPLRAREGRSLRVYIYHGNARRPDPAFLSDFDAVITTYATLASEFSKQSRSLMAEEDDDDAVSSEGAMDIDENGNPLLRSKQKKAGTKRKKLLNGATELPSALQSVHWFRVVLDEAHCIKETGTVASRACCDLMADRRLCLTGTPVQNKLDDVFALIKFLRLEPLNDKNTWTEYIGSPVKFGQAIGIARLQTIMGCITLRRTKETKTQDGKKILSLPPRRDELRYLKFDEQEQAIYDRFFTESKEEFANLTQKNEVMKNYVGILQKILRLRQICDHFELVEGKELGGAAGDALGSYEDLTSAITNEGLTAARAAAVFAILRESATTQCVECGAELALPSDQNQSETLESEGLPSAGAKRGRRPKAGGSRAPTRASSPNTPRAILTRCQHLFCLECFRNSISPNWPDVPPEVKRCCSACQTALSTADAFEVKPDTVVDSSQKKKPARKEKRQKGASLENFHPSTKVRALMEDLISFSRSNPHSVNYSPEIQLTDSEGNQLEEGGSSVGDEVVKTVVFSQWTSMLDKIEDALESAGIKYDRLDGTMKREERIKAMDALKHDPSCEVLLVSLKAGGVGLNLTAAQRVYLMDPYWNPAVENQAVDRIHRLGQTRPVTTVKLIIENSIEARLLEVQKKKIALANMTLGQTYTKGEILQRRLEELNALFNNS